MKCGALAEEDHEDGSFSIIRIPCEEEAVWYSCTPIVDIPVCEKHKCRCSKPIPSGQMSAVMNRRHF